MSQVLYRKYRSQNFDELYGQEHITKVIRQAIKEKKVAHAYLFNGPRGTGKTSTARIIAKSLNCISPEAGNPCNTCDSCLSITQGRFLDLVEIDAASNRGIDEIRDLKEKVNFLAAEGKVKVYIIDEVHMLTNEAFNALLKTLEEPPEHVTFVLATTEVHKLPQTVISRTQRFDFRLASSQNIRAKLEYILDEEGVKLGGKSLDLIIEAANGSYRDAETILEKVISASGSSKKSISDTEVETILGFANTSLVTKLIEMSLSGDVSESIKLLHKANEQGVDLSNFLKQILERLRAELIKNVKANQLGEIATYSKAIGVYTNAYKDIAYAPIPLLAIELAIFALSDVPQQTAVPRTTKVIKKTVDAAVKQENRSKPKSESSITPKASTQEVKDSPKSIGSQEEIDLVEEEEEAVEIRETSPDPAVLVTLEPIISNWPKLIDKAKVVNPHLSAILIKVRPYDLNENILKVKVPFDFHKKKLEKQSVRKTVAGLTTDIFNLALTMEVEVEKEEKVKAKEEAAPSNTSLVEEVFNELI